VPDSRTLALFTLAALVQLPNFCHISRL